MRNLLTDPLCLSASPRSALAKHIRFNQPNPGSAVFHRIHRTADATGAKHISIAK